MNYCIIFNRLIILFYLLNAFVPFTSSLWSGGSQFDADDVDENFGIRSSKLPSRDRERSRSPSRSFDRSGDSSRPHEAAKFNNSSQTVSKTLDEMEQAFIKMHLVYSKDVMWDIVVNNETEKLVKTCASVWINSVDKLCNAQAMSYKGQDGNALKAVFENEKKGYAIRTDFVKCRCRPHKMTLKQAKKVIPALYLAKYDESNVFLLRQVNEPHMLNLKIFGMTNI